MQNLSHQGYSGAKKATLNPLFKERASHKFLSYLKERH